MRSLRLPSLKGVADEGMGRFLVVKVNGQRILCRGGNWGMDDAMKRIPREKLEPYVRLHRDANLTMIPRGDVMWAQARGLPATLPRP